jgi:hypothetical protein
LDWAIFWALCGPQKDGEMGRLKRYFIYEWDDYDIFSVFAVVITGATDGIGEAYAHEVKYIL